MSEWSIQEIARLSGTTSRTLRHYGEVGLLAPSRTGANGYRYYDAEALVRLQRILLLRELGLGIPAIADVLDGQRDDTAALRSHRGWLQQEKHRLDRQIASVERTITALEEGKGLMAQDMFEGFDHTVHREEVVERWGADADARANDWWVSMSAAEKKEWQGRAAALAADWSEAAARGLDPAGDEAQALACRQRDWLAGVPGTPREGGRVSGEYLVGLGELYVADERFARNYGGAAGAELVRDALRVFVERGPAG